MKNKTTIIAVVIAVLVVGAGAFYFLTKDDNNINKTTTNSTNNTTSSSQEVQQETTKVTLSSALSKIGATGNEGPVNGNTYTLNGIEYKFEEPSNWQTSLNQRKQACDQGFVNSSYQVATDGSTWFATTNSNSDLAALVTALKGAGINAEVASYC
ncbi:MAG TPA: hypothetical protein VFB59_04445 [Candidatus Saccharimonadales bacterium]|nr:hypothetical protein [Candidatus Saccharimonadales bacterium]